MKVSTTAAERRTSKNPQLRRPWPERKDACKPNVQRALDENNIPALIEALPVLQKQFCEEYIKDFNGSAAVERTDSITKYPEKVAYLWLSNPGVKAYIVHLTQERTLRMKVDQGYLIQKLVRALEKAEEGGKLQDIRQISMDLMKALGMLSDKLELTGKDGEAMEIKKVEEDADEVSSRIASLVKRARPGGVDEDSDEGASSSSSV